MKYIIAGEGEKKEDEAYFKFAISDHGDLKVFVAAVIEGPYVYMGYFDNSYGGKYREHSTVSEALSSIKF